MKSSYELHSNPINQGALAGRYALKDLSNSGKFTNTINAIPVRFNIVATSSVVDKVLTLVEGSTLTFLDGHSDTNSDTTLFEYYVLNNKYSFHTVGSDMKLTIVGAPHNLDEDPDPSKYVYVVFNRTKDDERIELVTGATYTGHAFSYDEVGNIIVKQGQTMLPRPLQYDEVENYMYGYFGERCSVPLGYFDGNWNFHQFNSLGFYDQMFWVDRDVEILIPDGRTDTYGMKVQNVAISKITFSIFDGGAGHNNVIPMEAGALVLNKDGSVVAVKDFYTANAITADIESGYVHLTGDNYVYTVVRDEAGVTKVKQECVKLCDIALKDGFFQGITGENVYQAANLKDIKDDIEELKETTVHNTGDEAIEGNKVFTGDIVFENSTHNYINIVDGEILDDGNLTVNGTLEIKQSVADGAYIDERASQNIAYDGKVGGFHVCSDAWLVDVGTDAKGNVKYNEARNCLNIVGGSNAAEGGIILGRYRTEDNKISRMTKVYGKNGNLLINATDIDLKQTT